MNTKELENWTKNTLNSCIEKTNNDKLCLNLLGINHFIKNLSTYHKINGTKVRFLICNLVNGYFYEHKYYFVLVEYKNEHFLNPVIETCIKGNWKYSTDYRGKIHKCEILPSFYGDDKFI